MCIYCVKGYMGQDEVGAVDLDKPEIVEAADIVKWVYAQGEYGAGGPLHIQLDDYNLEDSFLTDDKIAWWTQGFPERGLIWPIPAPDGFPEGHEAKFLRLLELLRGLSLAERAAAVWIGHGRDPKVLSA